MGKYAWNDSTTGYLFELYMVIPLMDLFDRRGWTKYTLDAHNLFDYHVSNIAILAQLLSNKISIHGDMDRMKLESLCGKGHLLTHLNDPRHLFFMPEPGAGPDLTFLIDVSTIGDEPIMTIPVFVQTKLARKFDIEKAAKTINPKTFFNNKAEPDWCAKRHAKTLECLDNKYHAAKNFGVSFIGILVMYPRTNTGSSCYEKDGGIIIVIDIENAKDFFGKEALDLFNSVKKRTGFKKELSSIKERKRTL
ncbi:hypothetical protein BC938DRAFT_481362 [Jimgerdemannia flammicorona]|uniref:Uncharacterized protein n=1 Tax=Jimgerdemannia flammicorona TaxID=994334 RepID=A0A433QGF1_9FUNG|nr:hypothetical protein BC938DRAFT_481362 [Jimgerdemannia flammicorona]